MNDLSASRPETGAKERSQKNRSSEVAGLIRRGRGLLNFLRAVVACLVVVILFLTLHLVFLLGLKLPALASAGRNQAAKSAKTEKDGQSVEKALLESSPAGEIAAAEHPAPSHGRKVGRATSGRNARRQEGTGPSAVTSAGKPLGRPVSDAREDSALDQSGGTASDTASIRPPGPPADFSAPGIAAPQKISPELVPLLQAARDALQRHDTAAARDALAQAAAKAQQPIDKIKISRWQMLCDTLDEFWRVMGQVVARLQPLTIISVGQTEVIVVEASSQSLSLRAEGRNRTYALRQIPSPLVKELAVKSFGKDPESKLVLATYLAIDPKGDRDMARALLLDAMNGGADPGEMILEWPAFFDPSAISDFLDVGSRQAAQQMVEAALGPPAGTSPDQSKPADTTGPPAETAQPEDAPDVEVEAADSPAEKSRLAKQLLDSLQTQPDPVEQQLTRVHQARKLATEAGNVGLVLASIEAESKLRRIDRTATLLAALGEVAKAHSKADVHRDIALAAIRAAFDAIQIGKYQEANGLLDLAIASGRKGGSRAIVADALAAKQKLQASLRRP
jgi:hypothetical protein